MQRSQDGRRVEYSGKFVYYDERVQGGATCDFKQPHWSTSGSYRAGLARSGMEMVLRQEATGCSLTLRRSEGAWVGDGQSCNFETSPNLQLFGIVDRSFEQLRYDPSSRRLTAKGRMRRKAGDGTVRVSCFEEDVQLSAALLPGKE